jgi:TonB family protein
MILLLQASRSVLILAAVAAFGMAWTPASARAARQDGQIGPTKYYQDGKRIPPPANPPPVYPQKELRRRIGGTTVVAFTLDADGKINGAQVKTLDKAAVDSVLRWKAIPLDKNGKPFSGVGETEITFAP